ncbi:MAG: hypothetical protein F6K55_44550 [Moorea sp. SIO4A3]|nr:hypothetical protein [Moorena sp. SIO4A3]
MPESDAARSWGFPPLALCMADKAFDPTLNFQVFYRGRWSALSVAFPPRSL